MSTLQVANLHFESTGNNRIQYNSASNTFIFSAGGVERMRVSNSVSMSANLSVEQTDLNIANSTTNLLSASSNGLITLMGGGTTINSIGIHTGPTMSTWGMKKNKRVIDVNTTIYDGDNATLIGPISVAQGVTLTVEANTRFVIS